MVTSTIGLGLHYNELLMHRIAVSGNGNDYFAEHPPHTVAEAVEAIEQLTGIRRSQTQIRELLKRMGFSRRKVGALPAKADEEAQATFQKKS